MEKHNYQNYEKLYHLMNQRRGEEQKKLEEACQAFTRLYTYLIHKDELLHEGSISQERGLCNEAMVLLTSLIDMFRDTDQLIDKCAKEQGEPVIEPISGGKDSRCRREDLKAT